MAFGFPVKGVLIIKGRVDTGNLGISRIEYSYSI